MNVASVNEAATRTPILSRGWLHEVSGLTGSMLLRPLVNTAADSSDLAVATCRQHFLSWLLVGNNGDSGAQVALEIHLLRCLFPLIANLTAKPYPVGTTLSSHLSVVEASLTGQQIEANELRERIIHSNKSIEALHADLVQTCRQYASVCALEVAEHVIDSQTSWEEGNYLGSGHTLAEAILAYTSMQAYWAAVRFWTGECPDSPFVQIYALGYQGSLTEDGLNEPSLKRMLEAHEDALEGVRIAARREAAEKMEALLKE